MDLTILWPAVLLGVWTWVAAGVRQRRGVDWVLAYYLAIRVMVGWALLVALVAGALRLLLDW